MRVSQLLQTGALAALLAWPLAATSQTAAGDATATAPAAPGVSAPAAAPAPPSPNLAPNGNLMATLQGSSHFTILVKALNAANLGSVLAATPDLTLFAPTDEAFHALPAGELTALLDSRNAAILQQVLTYHLIHLNLDSSKFKGAKGPVETVEKGKVEIDGSVTPYTVNNASIIQTDVHATNGFIQVVDKVLLPPDVSLPTATADAATARPNGG